MRIKTFYYKDKDQAFLVSDQTNREVQKAILHGKPANTGGRTLYPILEDPTDEEIRKGKTIVPAYILRDGHPIALRWYWQVREHKKAHETCKPLGDGLCGFKMVRYAQWNEQARKWELCPMVNHADSVQEQVLDRN